MNIRRTLATLAATTVAAPVVLIAAPAAVAQPVVTQPVVAQPVVTQPTVTQPTVPTPVATDPFASCTSWTQSARTTSELVGFPTRLVAGTWSTFTWRTVNISKSPLTGIGATVDAAAWEEGTRSPSIKLTTQWYDRAAKKWRSMPSRLTEYTVITRTLKPGARSDVKMRVRADRAAKAGDGDTFEYGRYAGKDGVCGFAQAIHEYRFVVEPAAPTPTPTPAPKPATR
ncbi:hypothetical protein [Streptomyces sp. NPDC059957]|uniref:hypothetical protein n=1 Tax=unclassified Streptomyces TaxID=2593676 RepID=UPI0036669333